MIWLTWRQMRAQTLWTTAATAIAATYLLYLAATIRDAYRTNVTECTTTCDQAAHLLDDQFRMPLFLISLLLLTGLAAFGAFWGAPLLTRELETGTHRLVWNQTITRKHWLAAKFTITGGVGIILTGGLSLLFTWAVSPLDTLANSRFQPIEFATRNIAPFGYALLAFTLGLTLGLLIRKTLAAMALTLVAFLAVQLLMGGLARPNYADPVTDTIALADANAVGLIDGLGIGPEGATIMSYSLPGAWVLSDEIPVLTAEGTAFTGQDAAACRSEAVEPDECLAQMGATFEVVYQPADRYWRFQWIELGVTAGLSALLLGLAFWRVPRGLN